MLLKLLTAWDRFHGICGRCEKWPPSSPISDPPGGNQYRSI